MGTKLREPVVAGAFYPGESHACRRAVDACLEAAAPQVLRDGPYRIGVVPHAGWTFSGPTAAAVFATLAAGRAAQASPPTFVLLGAVHVHGVSRPTLPAGSAAWWTPLGTLELDTAVADALVAAAPEGVLARGDGAHADEHSLEVQLPFVATLFPGARIVPVAVPPGPRALALGDAVGEVARHRADVLIVASSDLTHYGPRYRFTPAGRGRAAHDFVEKENDRRIVDAMLSLDGALALELAAREQSACGSGAIAAALQAATHLGASKGRLVAYTTSARVRPDLGGGDDFVGYAGVVVSCPS